MMIKEVYAVVCPPLHVKGLIACSHAGKMLSVICCYLLNKMVEIHSKQFSIVVMKLETQLPSRKIDV
jgi:type IV secretory pathway VirB3-like protein